MTTKYIMNGLASAINKMLPSMGFCLIVFKFDDPKLSNYISNAKREDMVKALFETAYRLKGKKDSNEIVDL